MRVCVYTLRLASGIYSRTNVDASVTKPRKAHSVEKGWKEEEEEERRKIGWDKGESHPAEFSLFDTSPMGESFRRRSGRVAKRLVEIAFSLN